MKIEVDLDARTTQRMRLFGYINDEGNLTERGHTWVRSLLTVTMSPV